MLREPQHQQVIPYFLSIAFDVTRVAGIAFAQGKYIEVLTKLLIVVCFIFGSFLSGLMISYTSFHLGRAYGRIFLLASVILVLAVVVECNVAHSTSFMYLLTIVCGLQNGMTTRYSGAVLRTTHVTGSATDIGTRHAALSFSLTNLFTRHYSWKICERTYVGYVEMRCPDNVDVWLYIRRCLWCSDAL